MSIVTKLSSKGQLVIPSEIRRKLNIDENTRLVLREENGEIVIRVVNWDYIQSFRGVFKGKNSLTKALLKERKEERDREDKKTKAAWKK